MVNRGLGKEKKNTSPNKKEGRRNASSSKYIANGAAAPLSGRHPALTCRDLYPAACSHVHGGGSGVGGPRARLLPPPRRRQSPLLRSRLLLPPRWDHRLRLSFCFCSYSSESCVAREGSHRAVRNARLSHSFSRSGSRAESGTEQWAPDLACMHQLS